MNENIKTLIGWWKLKGEEESNPFVKFFFYYICFDAWITAESGEDGDEDKIKWFIGQDNCLKEKWLNIQSPETESWLNSLKNSHPIEDMRPRHRGEYKRIYDIHNLEQVIKYIYQIRCNLFHGSKDPMNSRDTNLVEISGNILGKWIRWAYLQC